MAEPMRSGVGAAEPSPPFLPPGEIVRLAGRGEVFVRRHVHPDPSAPMVLLLHGWTASVDLQFLAAYEALSEMCSFIGLDHRGHGRGLRTFEPYLLEDVADDAAAVCRHFDLPPVIAVGYSMGGPITLLLTRRHPELVAGIVVQATALEWRATLRERLTWKLLPLMGSALRSRFQPGLLRRSIDRIVPDDSPLAPYRGWLGAETLRGDPRVIVEAGRSLSRYDARTWASSLRVPAASLISTRDRLVKPAKQRALAAALDATVVEVPMDHFGTIEQPEAYAAATVDLVRRLHGDPMPDPPPPSSPQPFS